MNVNVEGGTNAGWRNPFAGSAMPWQCDCTVEHDPERDGRHPDRGCTWPTCYCDNPCPPRTLRKTNPGYLKRCPDCKQARP